jgi:hypothetical protein
MPDVASDGSRRRVRGNTNRRMGAMQSNTTRTGVEPPPSMPALTKAPDVAASSVPDTLATLKVNPEIGLPGAEVDTRRAEHGYNDVAERKPHPVLMLTFNMAIGSKELAKRGVLVTRLSAAEDAATMDVLCVDKTGTITMNQLAVTGVIPLEHATESDVLFAGALASQEANQDPIDLALLAAATERHVFDGRASVTPVSFAPFTASTRRTEAVAEQGGQRLRVMKGAVDTVAAVLGALMVAESLLALWVGWSHWGLAASDDALYTCSFLTLLYFAVFSIVSARERRWFWATLPSNVVMAAVVAETLVGTVLTFAGLPDLMPLPWWQTLALFAFAMVSCLVVNDAVKVALIRWRVPAAAA